MRTTLFLTVMSLTPVPSPIKIWGRFLKDETDSDLIALLCLGCQIKRASGEKLDIVLGGIPSSEEKILADLDDVSVSLSSQKKSASLEVELSCYIKNEEQIYLEIKTLLFDGDWK